MSTLSKRDAVAAAMSVAEDVTEGKLAPADLESEVTTACRELFGTVVGDGDPLFGLQCDIARAVLAAHGLPAAELREWAAVQARFEGTSPEG
jgi:hypothetical protein